MVGWLQLPVPGAVRRLPLGIISRHRNSWSLKFSALCTLTGPPYSDIFTAFAMAATSAFEAKLHACISGMSRDEWAASKTSHISQAAETAVSGAIRSMEFL